MSDLEKLRVKLFADGADPAEMRALDAQAHICGFTTNPTLMHKAGVRDYRRFAREVLAVAGNRPVSFEVCSDELAEMERQAREIATWGPSVFVKIPVTNTRGEASDCLIHRLSSAGVQVNVTAVMTLDQVGRAAAALRGGAPASLSVFAGRIADTGRDPAPIVTEAVRIVREAPRVDIIWASPREVLNVFQADRAGCHVITLTTDLLRKLPLVGRDLDAFSLETVRMFYCDAQKAGLEL